MGQYFEANTELRHSAFSRAELAVVPFQVREGIEGEHTPEMDLTRNYRVLEGGDEVGRGNGESGRGRKS